MVSLKRIAIIGGSGSGKSTLALKLGEITGLPVVHIDPMYWQAGWVQRTSAETERLALEAARRDTWIFEGNNSATMTERLERADMVIFLDVGTMQRLWRILKRTVRYYGRTRSDMAEGCEERIDWPFIKFVASYRFTGRPKAFAFLSKVPSVKVKHITGKADMTALLEDIREANNCL